MNLPVLVVVRTIKDHAEKVCNQMVQDRYLRDILQVVNVEVVIVENRLVEVCHDQLNVPTAAQLLV